jgi:hypothetical protein
MDLSNSVILPRDDFAELQEAAWNQPAATLKERAGGTAQMLIICAGIAGAITAASWGWAKAMDWREEKELQRAMTHPKYQNRTKV